jgi:hypothetical protein
LPQIPGQWEVDVMKHERPNTVYMEVRITLPDQEPSKVAARSLEIRDKIEGLLKKEKLDEYEVVLENIQKSR